MKDERIISAEQGNQLASKYNYIFEEISSVQYLNINDIFQNIIRTIKIYVEKRDNYEYNNIDDISIRRMEDRKCRGCC